jgi:hypothetical protein
VKQRREIRVGVLEPPASHTAMIAAGRGRALWPGATPE